MPVHIVHAHSESDSFVSAMRDVLVKTFSETGAEAVQSDLHTMGFNPVMSTRDFGDRKALDHPIHVLDQRHGYANRALAFRPVLPMPDLSLFDDTLASLKSEQAYPWEIHP
ncbi:MAG: NAD(P)H-dependent oxidoreductase [Rhodospirillum sp.]|nr:NAD(P)H-dependent oxidoreductase [Rhodospirillum sp.]MCF8491679.1 NAD(P)H-dependent oxidoreductase [Rhodospirillum sp.]MCF8501068.1 NAD(P)H-dependent oxidoreductase [Rhodospirillum sp.]